MEKRELVQNHKIQNESDIFKTRRLLTNEMIKFISMQIISFKLLIECKEILKN